MRLGTMCALVSFLNISEIQILVPGTLLEIEWIVDQPFDVGSVCQVDSISPHSTNAFHEDGLGYCVHAMLFLNRPSEHAGDRLVITAIPDNSYWSVIRWGRIKCTTNERR